MTSSSVLVPVVVRISNLIINGAKWSPNGRFIAICGAETVLETCRNVVHLMSAYGEVLYEV